MGLGKMLNYLNTQQAGWLTAPQGPSAEYRVTGEILPRLLVADAETSVSPRQVERIGDKYGTSSTNNDIGSGD